MYIIQYASFSSNKIVLVLLNDVYYPLLSQDWFATKEGPLRIYGCDADLLYFLVYINKRRYVSPNTYLQT